MINLTASATEPLPAGTFEGAVVGLTILGCLLVSWSVWKRVSKVGKVGKRMERIKKITDEIKKSNNKAA